jgi:hypothetical protein
MTVLEIGDDTIFYEKLLAHFRRIGIASGIVVGGAVGLIAGLAMHLYDRRRPTQSG